MKDWKLYKYAGERFEDEELDAVKIDIREFLLKYKADNEAEAAAAKEKAEA